MDTFFFVIHFICSVNHVAKSKSQRTWAVLHFLANFSHAITISNYSSSCIIVHLSSDCYLLFCMITDAHSTQKLPGMGWAA